MRLLKWNADHELVLTGPYYGDDIPSRYAVLSHTWGADTEEVTFAEVFEGKWSDKAGVEKIIFCGKQAERDGIEYFWVDTCCINKADFTELSEAITSMFRCYSGAEKCYAYLSDVSISQDGETTKDPTAKSWESNFLTSRWFNRGWTLQEMLAPRLVEFYSRDWDFLGTKQTLAELIHTSTTIPLAALLGASLSQYSIAERLRWAEPRKTKRIEDRAYCLLGIFDVFMPLIYGEGENAFRRLEKELQQRSKQDITTAPQASNEFGGVYAHVGLQPVITYVSRLALESRLCEQLPPISNTNMLEGMRTVVIWGLGGAGKSQLVLRFMQQQRQHYQAIFWIEAGRKETLERDYIQIYKLIHNHSRQSSSNDTAITVEDAVSGVKMWLQRQKKRCLWIVDSVDDVDDSDPDFYIDLNHYLPETLYLDRIVTTRSSLIQAVSSKEAIEVRELTEDEAVNLLQRCCKLPSLNDIDQQNALKIVKELGCFALAITLAGSYIRENPEIMNDLRLYFIKFQQQRGELLNQKPHRLVHQYSESVLSTWEISYSRIKRQSPMAASMLSLLAFLNFDDIFLDLFLVRPPIISSEADVSPKDPSDKTSKFRRLFRKYSYHAPDDSRHQQSQQPNWIKLISDEGNSANYETVKNAFKTLQAYSLVSWRSEQGAYNMHKLVHAWSHDRLTEAERQIASSAVLELLSIIVQECEGRLDVEQRLLPHVTANFVALSNAYQQNNLMPIEDLPGLYEGGELMLRLGRWGDAYKIHGMLLQMRVLKLGERHPSTLKSMNGIAIILRKQGQYELAEKLYRQTLGLLKIVFGQWHPYTLLTMSNLGLTLSSQGQYKVAEELQRQTLEIQKTVLGERHPDTLMSMSNLGFTLSNQGRYKVAEELHRQTLEIQKMVLGERHANTLISMSNLGLALSSQGRYKVAEELHRQTLEIQKMVLGERHPNTLVSMHNIGITLHYQGQYEIAEKIYRETLELQKTVLGEWHPNTLTTMHNLGVVLYDQDQCVAGEELLHQTLHLATTVLGKQHPHNLMTTEVLVGFLKEQGKYEEAESIEIEYAQD